MGRSASTRRPLRLLLLFEKEWDAGGFGPLLRGGEIEVVAEGFDLFRFPGNARVLSFDAWAFVDRICRKYRGRIDAVASNNEQFGALLAAVVAERLGLAGNDPAAVCRSQHKLLARQLQHRVAPEATVRSAELPFSLDDPRVRQAPALAAAVAGAGIGFPVFVKPVKATFSVLARRVRNAAELARHLDFGSVERLIIRRLVVPYAQVAERLVELPCDSARIMLEEPVDGHQVNVDGYVFEGEVRVLGVVDEWMYPEEHAGAKHFLRFGYPSLLPEALQARIVALTRKVLAAVGFRHGFFNCEFFVLPDGSLRFIEINPRLASQLVSLYRDVDGLDIYRMLVALAAGQDPVEVPRRPASCGASASFVFRRFDGQAPPPLAAGALDWLSAEYPGAQLARYPKSGRGLSREYKWLGSHRYAVLNLGAADEAALDDALGRICRRFGWPCLLPDRSIRLAGPGDGDASAEAIVSAKRPVEGSQSGSRRTHQCARA